LGIHGKYRFQLRVRAPDRTKLKLKLYFETGIMSIPRLFAGKNTLRFRVADPTALQAEVTVVYRYETAAGEKTHRHVLRRAEFRGGEAVYTVDAPGLLRCRSVSISY
jgi:hypothetical protein